MKYVFKGFGVVSEGFIWGVELALIFQVIQLQPSCTTQSFTNVITRLSVSHFLNQINTWPTVTPPVICFQF